MAQITTDPHDNLIVSADIALQARKIDFVTQFAKNWDALREVMGITRPIRKANYRAVTWQKARLSRVHTSP